MQKGLAVVTFLSLMLLGAASARAEEPQAKVEAALNELHQWVGEGATGEGWRKFLKSDALAAELAKGAEADPKVVGEVLAQYQSGKPGLEMSRFAAVREALAAWEAELLKPTAAELPKLVRDAAGSYQPVKPEAVTQAKAELTAAVSDLDRYLSRDPKGVAGWKKFLRWDELTPIVQAQEPPPTEAVAAAVDRFRANQKGLELPQFTRVRIALENYAAAAVAAANGGLQEQFAQRLEALAKQLETYSQDPAAGDEAIAIGRTLGWLERNHQSPELVTAVRMVYSQPNLYAYASKRLAAVGIEEEIDENQPVRDNILGTSIYGTARMKGHTKLELLDSPSAALFNVLLTGQASSNNVGYNSGVSIYTTGLTQISGIKQLKMDVNGMTAGAAAASCQTATSINNIGARGRMVERIAWNRATGAQGQAQAIASNHAEARVANQMNERSAKLVAEQNDRYFNKFKNPLVRRGHFPRDLNFSSRPDRAEVRMLQASAAQIASPVDPPAIDETHDMALRAHESVVVNFSEGVLGGVTLTDLRLEKLLRDDLKTEVPDDLRVTLPDGKIDLEKEPWAIRFARELPVRAKFNGGKLWLAIRADTFFRGQDDLDAEYNKALEELIEISADYTIERTDAGATLRRQGDVVISFPDAKEGERSTRRTTAAAFLRVKFRNLFKEEFVGEGLTFKGRFERAGKLTLQEIKSDAAWLTLGWKMPPADQAVPPAAAEAPPATSGGG